MIMMITSHKEILFIKLKNPKIQILKVKDLQKEIQKKMKYIYIYFKKGTRELIIYYTKIIKL